MGGGQPGGAGVVEVGQGALFQVGLGGVGRVEPGFAQVVQGVGGVGDGVQARVAPRFLAGGQGRGKVSKQVVGV